MNNNTTTSTASIFYEPTKPEFGILPEGIRVVRSATAPGYQLWYVNITSNNQGGPGHLVTLTLNESGDACIEADVVPVPYRPSFIAPTKNGGMFIAAEQAVWLHGPDGGKKLADLPFTDENAITNDGCVLSAAMLLIGSKSTLDPKQDNAPAFLYNALTGAVETLPIKTKIGNGCFLHKSKLYHIDTPTQAIRVFDFLDIAAGYNTLIEFEDGFWPDGMVGPFEYKGNFYCTVGLWNSDVSTSAVVVVDLANGKVVHEVLVRGAGQVTCMVVHNGFMYITTALEGLTTPEQLELHPNGGSIFIAKAPPMLSNPPDVPLLDIE